MEVWRLEIRGLTEMEDGERGSAVRHCSL